MSAADTPGWPVEPGSTALSVPVPEVDAVVRGWRGQYDTAAQGGGTAHVTVLFPFVPAARFGAAEQRRLRRLCAEHPPFVLEFPSFARFPGVLYLEPVPDYPLRALTKTVTEEWPEYPPYGGLFGDGLDPHLTVANSGGAAVRAAIEADLSPRLPITAPVTGLSLAVHDGERWREWLTFPLGGAPPEPGDAAAPVPRAAARAGTAPRRPRGVEHPEWAEHPERGRDARVSAPRLADRGGSRAT
ncbi:2'-5' RNA ligase family protein [Streptomyces sp. AJS327]|uniref:2'-5' RNA ligase family protein n=1 Tax=Streptomyces sp. AJS327 TaxID=2545265 RepID=UPI0015DE7976|nr:2'-5' RNA ligase family protein [Streptomyces sp. AJS327]MBA0051561.1 2'-5' RNA ligase family protein [Streptomyces sp. AJS327]